MKKLYLFSIAVTLFLLKTLITGAQTVSVTGVVYQNNTAKIPFTVPEGKINVYLPDDMAEGDHVSGTVVMEPSGKNENQKQKNLGLLQQYVLTIGKMVLDSKLLNIGPAPGTGKAAGNFDLSGNWWGHADAASVSLSRMKEPVAKVEIPLLHFDIEIRSPGEFRPSTGIRTEQEVVDYKPSKKIITGNENLVLHKVNELSLLKVTKGSVTDVYPPFRWSINDKPVIPLCSSPRQTVIPAAAATTGKNQVTAKTQDGKTVYTDEFYKVDIQARIDKTNLLRGERTNMQLSVDGMQECPYPFSMSIVDRTPGIILLDKGAHQTHFYNPTEIKIAKGNTWNVQQGVTGVVPGRFDISANLILPGHLFGDVFHQQKSALKTPEDYNAWADALKKDLQAYADKQGNDAAGQAAKQNAQRAIDNIPKCHDKNKLEECKAFADAYLRPVNVPKGAATMWVCGFEAYKAAIKAITGTLGGKPELIDWEVIKNGLEFIRNMGEQLDDEALQNGAGNAKKLVETIQKAGETKEKLEQLNETLEELTEMMEKKLSLDPQQAFAYKMEDFLISSFQYNVPGYITTEGTNVLLNISGQEAAGIYSLSKTAKGIYEMQINPGVFSPVYHWISSSLSSNPILADGSITVPPKRDGSAAVIDFKDALITEFEIPALDANEKNPIYLTIKIQPEKFECSTGSSDKVKATGTKQGKKWLPGNFKIEIGDLHCKKIHKVDAFKITQKTVELPVGPVKEYKIQPGQPEFSTIKITLPETDIQRWKDWYDHFDKTNEVKNGSITVSDEKAKPLYSVSMNNIKPVQISPAADGSYQVIVQPGNVGIMYDTKPGDVLFNEEKIKELEDSLRKAKDELEKKKRERDITIDDEIKKAEKRKRDCDEELEKAEKDAVAKRVAFEKAKKKKENIEKNTGPGKTFPDKEAAKKHFGDYEAEYNKAKEAMDLANINLGGLMKKCPELTKALENLKNRKTVALPGEIEKGEKDVKELEAEIEREKTKAEEEKKRLEDEQRKKEEEQRQKTQAEKDAEEAKYKTKAENVYLLQNIYSLGLISAKVWETPGLMDWLPDALEKPVGDAAEDLVKTPIPLDAINAIAGLYGVVAAKLDPCTAEGSITTIKRLKSMTNSKTKQLYTDDEALDKTERMCEVLKKIKAIAAAAKGK